MRLPAAGLLACVAVLALAAAGCSQPAHDADDSGGPGGDTAPTTTQGATTPENGTLAPAALEKAEAIDAMLDVGTVQCLHDVRGQDVCAFDSGPPSDPLARRGNLWVSNATWTQLAQANLTAEWTATSLATASLTMTFGVLEGPAADARLVGPPVSVTGPSPLALHAGALTIPAGQHVAAYVRPANANPAGTPDAELGAGQAVHLTGSATFA